MFYISEKEFDSKMKKIKAKNQSKERALALKNEKKKYRHLIIPKIKTSNKVLMAAIIAVILFSATCLYIQYNTGIEVSSTLITLWYSFWTVEIVSLAGIKISKVFKDYQSLSSVESNNLDTEANNALG